MANQIICDKCGEIIEGENENEIHITKVRNTRFGYDKRINLCDKHMDELQVWFDGTVGKL